MYSKETIEKVKNSVDIVDVIDGYQRLIRRGKIWLGVCPFHNDTTPSLTVNKGMQIYKCFACGAGGDVFSYVQHAEGATFVEAVRTIADIRHIELPNSDLRESEEDRKVRIERERLLRECRDQQADFLDQARMGWRYAQYLEERKISQEAAKAFCLGAAYNGEFAHRITYPFFNLAGKVIGWTGRDFSNEQGAKSKEQGQPARPKYKNSAESVLFKKDEILFGLYQGRNEIQRRDMVYIVEGQNDVIRMWMSGYQNTVAGSGTAFSEKQARLISRFTKNITLVYDGDAAGQKATLRTMKLLLPLGFNVAVITLPDSDDPDTFLLSHSTLPQSMGRTEFLKHLYPAVEDPDKFSKNIEEACKIVALVPDKFNRDHSIVGLALYYNVDKAQIISVVNRYRTGSDTDWQSGLYGLDEAREVLKNNPSTILHLTFNKNRYVDNYDNGEAWVMYQGVTQQALIQQLRLFDIADIHEREVSPETLPTIEALHADGRTVYIQTTDLRVSFTTWFVTEQTREFYNDELDAAVKTEAIRRCLQVIANTDSTERELNSNIYKNLLRLPAQAYNKLLKDLLQQRKDKYEAERKRLELEEKATSIDLYDAPDYVMKDEVLLKQYNQYGFYPLRVGTENARYAAYVFKNEKGGGHSIVSDFYIEALLFVDPASDHPKRVIRLTHLHGGQQYIECSSDTFVSLMDMKKRLFASGAYNFNGTPQQWDRIRQVLSYNFISCYEARVFGWQPEGFFMWPNAVYYPEQGTKSKEQGARNKEQELSEQGTRIDVETSERASNGGDAVRAGDALSNVSTNGTSGGWRLEYMDKLGVAEVNGMKFYSPAASQIRLAGRIDDNPYEQDELAYYIAPQGKDATTFTDWAALMDRVFAINDNGKWAVMFAIACSFRDLIYKIVGSFTALCFAGPTGSGKTELAYGIRGLWIRRRAAVFNLNSGSDAAFFITLEHFRNVPVIMEEYNDNSISQIKFQGLKAAVYDDKGRMKVKDISSKSLDISKTNAAPILLGQDTPQQDDGSLSNRVIICEVPRKEGGFSPSETAEFERLKRQSDLGMGNVLLDIIRQRPVFEEHYRTIFNEEVDRMKKATWDSTTNKEGLERVVRSVAILSATARIVEERCDIKLPWRYSEFYDLAINKVPKQMDSIAKTSKLGSFFQALNTLLSLGKVIPGREFKLERSFNNTVKIKEGVGTKEVEIGKDTLLLYIQLEECYHAYSKVAAPKDILSKQTLVNYFKSHSAYIGQTKSVRFSWKEPGYNAISGVDASGKPMTGANMQMIAKSQVTSAYIFNYEVLKELLDIDYLRSPLETQTLSEQGTPAPKQNDLPF